MSRRPCSRPGGPIIAAISAPRSNEGASLGPLGANVANKAANIYATYLETDAERKREIFLQSARARARRCRPPRPISPTPIISTPRRSAAIRQEISVAKALAQGLGGKVKASLDKAIELAPGHAEAHIALGAYNAEVVAKVGGLLASLTYGASKEAAVKHFDMALQAAARFRHRAHRKGQRPRHAVRQSQSWRRREGSTRRPPVQKPADAMQKLDAEHAKEEAA